MNQLSTYLDFAIQTVYEAGRLTLGYFNRGIAADFKKDDTPVTIADREAEILIRERIEKRFPDHAIEGEEFGQADKKSAFRWFVDPIDGTKSFVCGVPLYTVLLGLEIEGRIQVGAAYLPALNEMVYAASGTGCFCNGRQVHVRETESLARGIMSFTDPATFERYHRMQAWQRLQKATWHRTGLSDAYGHILVATGRIDLMLDPVMNAWDCGPFPVILREAGGYFGDWSGNETINGDEALSTTIKLLPEVLEIIRSSDQKVA
jgi:histidinol-phosphatase